MSIGPWLENIVIVIVFGYATFVAGYSGWWWLVAIAILNTTKKRSHDGQT